MHACLKIIKNEVKNLRIRRENLSMMGFIKRKIKPCKINDSLIIWGKLINYCHYKINILPRVLNNKD